VWKAGKWPLPQAARSMARNAKIAKVRQDRCASPRGSPLGARRLTGGGKEAKSHGRKEHGADHLCAVPEQPVCSSSVEQMMTCNASKGTYACFCTKGRMLYAYFEKNKIRPTNSTTCYPSPHHTRPTPGLSPSWAPLPAPLSKSGCQATTSRTPPVGMPSPFARSSACTGSSTTAEPKQVYGVC
jgi:hypothetical protein